MATATDAAIRKLEELMSRDPLLREVFAETLPRDRRPGHFVPDVEVLELPDRYLLLVEVPGVSRDDLHVDLVGNRLVVRGRKLVARPAGATTKLTERKGGSFTREFLVPRTIAPEDVTARLDSGVLTITLPRSGDATTSRSVEIDA